jgi:hypothetical protein
MGGYGEEMMAEHLEDNQHSEGSEYNERKKGRAK